MWIETASQGRSWTTLLQSTVWRTASIAAVVLALALAAWPARGVSLNVGEVGDRLFLSDFHGDERAAGRSYRWTKAESTMTVPGMGGSERVRVVLLATADGAPQPVPVTVKLDGQEAGTVVVSADGEYQVAGARADPRQDTLVVTLSSPTFRPLGDARDLGVIVTGLEVTTLSSVPAPLAIAERWLRLSTLAVSFALLLGGAARRWHPATHLALAGILVAAAAWLARPWLLAGWPWLLGGGLALAALLRPSATAELIALGLRSLDRPRVALAVVSVITVAYMAWLTVLASQIEWIGHADYADNAVVARNLVQGRGYTVDYVAQFYLDYPRSISHPADVWPLLQPTLIAGSFLLFGVSTFAAKLPNIIIMGAMLLGVFWLGRRLFSPLAGVLAAGVMALDGWFFQNALFPVNDVGFSLFTLGMLGLMGLADQREESGEQPRLWHYAVMGALAGLLTFSKPSGLLLVLGAAAAWVWQRRRGGAIAWPGWRVIAAGIAVAGLAIMPLVVRNMVTYGRPYFTTETYDAWVLKWDPPDENIYRLRADNLPHPRELVAFGGDRLIEAVAQQFRKFGQDIADGKYLETGVLVLAAAGLVLGSRPVRRQALTLVSALVPYLLLVQVYWHYEQRYYVFLVPWLAVYAAGGVVLLWTWLREDAAVVRQHIAVWALVLGLLVFVPPRIEVYREAVDRLTSTHGDVTIARWLVDHTEPDAVIMTRYPWQITWHSGRRTVMVPLASREEILATMRKYGVDYLLVEKVYDRRFHRSALAPLYEGTEAYGFQKVWQWGENAIVYRVPPDVASAP